MTSPDQHRFDEARRLASLHALDLLDSAPQAEFDALVALAAEMLGCPTAMLTLIDRDRQWIKAGVGTEVVETPRAIAFCDHTIRYDDATVVGDATQDPRFAASPLVIEHGFRFYAGLPIHARDDEGVPQAIGALCVLDTAPRALGDLGRQALGHLATLAEALIAARRVALDAIDVATRAERLAADLARQDLVFRQAERMARIGSWRMSLVDDEVHWSEGVYRIRGLPVGERTSLTRALDHYPPAARAEVTAALTRTIETGEPFAVEVDFLTAQGEPRRVRGLGERELVDGRPVAVVGVLQDVTDRHALETALRRSADTDILTGLCNRAAFERLLDAAIAEAREHDTPLVLALADLDGFKAINDTFGHTAGDDVLKAIGRSLADPWLAGCIRARLGGDEFAMICTDSALAADPAGFAERLEQALRVPVPAGGITLTAAGTVGVARLGPEHATLRDLVHQADMALYAAKRARVGERRLGERRRAAG